MCSTAARAAEPTVHWDPPKTRAFVAGLARFEGEKDGETSFSVSDRTDTTLVALLKARGVADANVRFLRDEQATLKVIKETFLSLLAESKSGETLIFYFGSHGGYDATKGRHTLSTFEAALPIEWVFDAIEANFKGSQALLFADACYSGGVVEMAARRSGKIAYAALSSTSSHNVAWSGWRFVDVLRAAFGGDPKLDTDNSATITFSELSDYASHHMAFVADGKPMSFAAKEFPSRFVLASRIGAAPHREVGKYYEVNAKDRWYKAQVLRVDGAYRKVHYTSYDSRWDEWVTADRMRAYTPPKFGVGTRVECQGNSSKAWYPGTVIASFDALHLCHYDGWSSAYDEWMGPSRIRSIR